MARPKKVINEVSATSQAGAAPDNDKTESQKSLHPSSHPANDPKAMPNRTAMLAKMIGAANAVTDDEWLKLFNGMMSYHDKAGHGMGIKDGQAGGNLRTQDTHASGASSSHNYGQVKMPTPHLKDGGMGGLHDSVKHAIAQDVETMLEGQEGLSEEFKTAAATLFEAAVEARVAAIQTELTEAADQKIEEEITGITQSLVEGLDTYLDYVANEWMQENQVAVESSLRNELASEFITGLRNLFVEHNFNIPEEQVAVVDTMAERIAELEKRLNDALMENAELNSTLVDVAKKEAVAKLSEGLTLAESEKLRELAENVDADTLEQYETKVKTIKESNFVKGTKKSSITEQMEAVDEDNKPEDKPKQNAPDMQRYAMAISRTLYR